MPETCLFCFYDWQIILMGRKTESRKSIREGTLVSTATIVSMFSAGTEPIF